MPRVERRHHHFAKDYWWLYIGRFIVALGNGTVEAYINPGALTLNAVAGVGMLAAGIVGGPFAGYFRDTQVEKEIVTYDSTNNTQLKDTYVIMEKKGVFGKYMSLDHQKVEAAPTGT